MRTPGFFWPTLAVRPGHWLTGMVSACREPGHDSQITFFELSTRVEEDGNVVVGRADTGVFVLLPEVGARIIQELNRGTCLGKVEESLSASGPAVDVVSFVRQLGECGFVRAVNGVPVIDAPSGRRASLPWLKDRHVAWMFTASAYAAYSLVVAAAVAVLVLQPRIRPHYADFFFSSSTSVVLAGSTALFIAIAALHEFAHLASARAAGVPARISLGTRLYSLVAQTDVSGMWAASRADRMRTYLAGMGMDLVLGSVLILARLLSGADGWPNHVMAAAVVLILTGIAGQFQLFLRTDLYFIAADWLKARNLFEDATVQLGHTVRSWTRQGHNAHPLAGLLPGERRVVKGYCVVMIAGTLVSLTVFAAYLLPALVLLLIRAAHHLSGGIASHHVMVALDGAITIVVESGTELLVAILALRSLPPWLRRLRCRLSQHADPT